MFMRECMFFNMRKRSIEKFRSACYLDNQRHWLPHEPGPAKEGVSLPYHGVYAQNDIYLEVDNPGWRDRWILFFVIIFITPFALYLILIWIGASIYPMFTGQMIDPVFDVLEYDIMFAVFGWIVLIIGACACAVAYAMIFTMGGKTMFFGPLRGRIRFNRQTRKVYVLRPKSCGGNAVFEWDRLRALMEHPESRDPQRQNKHILLTLYHPPWDANDSETKGEDLIPVGAGFILGEEDSLAGYWEYIRLYMEEGPTNDIPLEEIKPHHRKIPRHIPRRATTYCGKMGFLQYREESIHQNEWGREGKASLLECVFFWLSQLTCYWLRFPPEWKSDSGLGEPEDKPVQTGAIMTAQVYRQQGKLSRDDEIALLKIYGTPEALKAVIDRKT